jgi:TP901 family phage tail tape measure protein
MMGAIRQFQSAVTYIKEMDTAINGIAKVTTFSTKRLLEMKDAAIQMGKELGHSSIDIMKAQAEFARVVKDPKSINDLTKTAIVASNVTTMTAEEAAKAINLTRISFKMSAEDSMKILDMWNEIQNNFRKLMRN